MPQFLPSRTSATNGTRFLRGSALDNAIDAKGVDERLYELPNSGGVEHYRERS
jgi:hypothetical protein